MNKNNFPSWSRAFLSLEQPKFESILTEFRYQSDTISPSNSCPVMSYHAIHVMPCHAHSVSLVYLGMVTYMSVYGVHVCVYWVSQPFEWRRPLKKKEVDIYNLSTVYQTQSYYEQCYAPYTDITMIHHHAMPCHTTLCHATPWHVTPCCTMSLHTTPHHTMPCHSMLCYTTPQHITSCHTTPYHATACHATPHHTTPHHVTSHHFMSYKDIHHDAMLCHAIQRYKNINTFKSIREVAINFVGWNFVDTVNTFFTPHDKRLEWQRQWQWWQWQYFIWP